MISAREVKSVFDYFKAFGTSGPVKCRKIIEDFFHIRSNAEPANPVVKYPCLSMPGTGLLNSYYTLVSGTSFMNIYICMYIL